MKETHWSKKPVFVSCLVCRFFRLYLLTVILICYVIVCVALKCGSQYYTRQLSKRKTAFLRTWLEWWQTVLKLQNNGWRRMYFTRSRFLATIQLKLKKSWRYTDFYLDLLFQRSIVEIKRHHLVYCTSTWSFEKRAIASFICNFKEIFDIFGAYAWVIE